MLVCRRCRVRGATTRRPSTCSHSTFQGVRADGPLLRIRRPRCSKSSSTTCANPFGCGNQACAGRRAAPPITRRGRRVVAGDEGSGCFREDDGLPSCLSLSRRFDGRGWLCSVWRGTDGLSLPVHLDRRGCSRRCALGLTPVTHGCQPVLWVGRACGAPALLPGPRL